MKFLIALLGLPLALAAPAAEALGARATATTYEVRACGCQNMKTGVITAAGVCKDNNGVTTNRYDDGNERGFCRSVAAPPIAMENIFTLALCRQRFGKDTQPLCQYVLLCENGKKSSTGAALLDDCTRP
ncbi:hypothetical protein RB595_010198 [Gaeumannomyces hyphopodioides]